MAHQLIDAMPEASSLNINHGNPEPRLIRPRTRLPTVARATHKPTRLPTRLPTRMPTPAWSNMFKEQSAATSSTDDSTSTASTVFPKCR